MNPRIRSAQPLENYILEIEFQNGKVGCFDVRAYLEKGIFQRLKDEQVFRAVRVNMGTVEWADELDLCPDTVYLESNKVPWLATDSKVTSTQLKSLPH